MKELRGRDGRMRFRSRGFWRRRDVELDPAAGRVQVVERRFLSRKAWTAELRAFTCVLQDVWRDPGASVTLYHPKGWNVDFGAAPSTADADALARRLSAFLGLPLRRPEDF